MTTTISTSVNPSASLFILFIRFTIVLTAP